MVLPAQQTHKLPRTCCCPHTTEGITLKTDRVVRLEPSSRSSASIEMAWAGQTCRPTGAQVSSGTWKTGGPTLSVPFCLSLPFQGILSRCCQRFKECCTQHRKTAGCTEQRA